MQHVEESEGSFSNRTGLLFIHKEAPDRWRQPRTTQYFCDFM